MLVSYLNRREEALEELAQVTARPDPPRAVICLALVLKAAAGERVSGLAAARMMPLDLRSAAGLFDELPTWLPFGSHHPQEIAFVRLVEQRFAAVADTLGRGLPALARARGMYSTFLDLYDMPAAHDLRQALQRARECQEVGAPAARDISEEVVAAARSTGDLPNEAEARRLLARIAEAEGRWADLTAELLAVVDLVERMRERVGDGDTRIELDLTPSCAQLIELVVDGRAPDLAPARAVELAERSRSRLLLEVFGSSVSHELPLQLAELRDREAGTEQGRVREGVLPRPGGTDFTPRDIHPARQRQHRADREAVWAELEATGAARRGPCPAPARSTGHLRGTARGASTGRRALRTRPPRTADAGPGGARRPARADRLRGAAGRGPRPAAAARAGRSGPLGEPLEPLLRAVADHSAPGETLWLVPDGPLHDLPLHAVEVDGTPLGERNPLCVTPSASLLRHRLGQAPDAGVRRALIMADPVGDLPHARAEAHLIGGLLPDVEVYTGASATRRRLLGG